MTKALSKKVLLIGWDAADWKVMSPLMDAGEMPNLKRFVEQGVMGNLATIYPILSPMLWTSIATGKRAHKHGIHGFIEPDPRSGGVRPITNLGRKTKALWNILNQEGLQSNVISWWPSNPVEPINGVMVSDLYHKAKGNDPDKWPMQPGMVHPKRLIEPLKEFRVHPKEIEAEQLLAFVPQAKKAFDAKDKRLHSVAKILAECSSVHGAATATMQLEPWDFMAVYFDAIDHFSHGFMKYHPPQLAWVNDDDFDMYKDVVNSGYRFHDLMLGTYMELAGDDTTIIIVSDHGFHPDHLRPKDLPNEPAGPAEEHRHFGMIAAMGPGIRKDELLFGATLLDITPTILALMGKPLGKDMDGRPLLNAFDQSVDVEYIDSWDNVPGDDGTHPEGMVIDPVDQHEALKQLADLGYIDEPDENQAVAVAKTVAELRYNLARDLLDSGKLNDSLSELQALWQEFDDQSRFGVKIFDIQLMLKAPKEARLTLDKIRQRKEKYADVAVKELKQLEDDELKDKSVDELADSKRKNIRKLRQRASFNPFTMIFLEARLLAAENRLEEALVAYKQILDVQEHNRPHLYQCIAELLQRQKKWQEAEEWFNKILAIDSINAVAHFGLASCYVAQRKNKLALHEAKATIGLQFHNPKAHFILGVCLHRLNQIEAAIEALKVAVSQNPFMADAHKRLQYIYRYRLNNSAKAAEYQLLAISTRKALREQKRLRRAPVALAIDSNVDAKVASLAELSINGQGAELGADELVVVSGLPRSGTSMMMQMLQAGGIKAFVDDKRQADEDNPKGYFEHANVKTLGKDASWLNKAAGHSIKVITQLLPGIPVNKKLRIIYMERDLREILASQTEMLNRRDKKGSSQTSEKLANTYIKQVDRVKIMLKRRAENVQLKSINYADMVAKPEQLIAGLNEFFGGSLNTQAMLSVVDPNLYRQKFSSTDESLVST